MQLKFPSPARLLPELQAHPSILMTISTCPKTELLISPNPPLSGSLGQPINGYSSFDLKKKKSLHLFLLLPYYLCPSSNSIFSVRPLKYMGTYYLSSVPCLPPRLTTQENRRRLQQVSPSPSFVLALLSMQQSECSFESQ